MAQQPGSERSPLRAVKTERMQSQQPAERADASVPTEGATVQNIWDIVRKSTDVIVALREENSLLRSELSSLRKSESVMHDRLQDLLVRIDELENKAGGNNAAAPQYAVPGNIDRVEDSREAVGGSGASGVRTTTITITIQDDTRSDLERRVNGLVQQLVEELKRGI